MNDQTAAQPNQINSANNIPVNTAQAAPAAPAIPQMQMQDLPPITFSNGAGNASQVSFSPSPEAGPVRIEVKAARGPEASADVLKPVETAPNVEFTKENVNNIENRDAKPVSDNPVQQPVAPAAAVAGTTDPVAAAANSQAPVAREIKLPPVQGYPIENPQKYVENPPDLKQGKNNATTALYFLVQRLLQRGGDK